MEEQGQRNRVARLLLVGFFALAVLVVGVCAFHHRALPEGVGRPLTQEETAEVIARNSPLTSYVYLSPNATFPRTEPIQVITIHHMAGDLTLEGLGEAFGREDRRASSTYAIDSQGRIALYVEEANRPWTSSSQENDDRAVTIEVANCATGGDWPVSEEAYAALLELCTDICRRNGIQSLRFTGDTTGNLTMHSMFNSDTQCPGPWLEHHMEDIAREVSRRLRNE